MSSEHTYEVSDATTLEKRAHQALETQSRDQFLRGWTTKGQHYRNDCLIKADYPNIRRVVRCRPNQRCGDSLACEKCSKHKSLQAIERLNASVPLQYGVLSVSGGHSPYWAKCQDIPKIQMAWKAQEQWVREQVKAGKFGMALTIKEMAPARNQWVVPHLNVIFSGEWAVKTPPGLSFESEPIRQPSSQYGRSRNGLERVIHYGNKPLHVNHPEASPEFIRAAFFAFKDQWRIKYYSAEKYATE